jgi:cytoskeletal protein CcmA (bactofilin family)
MSASRSIDDTFINSIVGPGTFFRGHLELNGLLRIDGDFSGSIKTAGKVIVGQAGRADCAIEASSVVVGGLFRGEIFATEKVVLLASSVVIGSIVSPRLIAENGVSLNATFRVTGTPIDPATVTFLGKQRKQLLLESVRTREGALSGQREREQNAGDKDAPFSKQYERQQQWSG